MSLREALLAFALAGSLYGCRSPQHHDGPDDVRAQLILGTSRATQSLDASIIWPCAPLELHFRMPDERSVRHVWRESSEHGAEWMIEEPGTRTEYVSCDSSNSFLLHAVIDHSENALTLFEPPLHLSPSILQPGETVQSRSSMRVVDARDHRRLREKGEARREMTYVHDARIRLADGEYEVAVLDVRFTADLRLANAIELTRMHVSRQEGVLSQHSQERITVLRFSRETQRQLVRE